MRIKSNILGIIAITAILGGIFVSSLLNFWHTESTKEPARIKSGEFKGEYDPGDIRGSYTFGDIENAFKVPVDVLGKAFGIDEDQDLNQFQVKNLESIYADLEGDVEIGTGSVRIFVGLYTGLPVEFSKDEHIPQPAAEILIERGGLSEEQLQLIKSNSIMLPAVSGTTNQENMAQSGNESSASSEEHEEEIGVKGKTTFDDVITWGISKEKIEEIIGGKITARGMTIRDYCTQNGISFSTVKDKLNALLPEG